MHRGTMSWLRELLMNEFDDSERDVPSKGKLPYTPPQIRILTDEEAERVKPLLEAELRKRKEQEK